jgi:nitroreductase
LHEELIMTDVKRATPDHPIHDLLASRWSPYGFADRAVRQEDLRSLFEAARWAASSMNEQPWRFIIATRDDADAFQRMLSCLVEGNREWAARVPVLVLTAARRTFARNDKPNDTSWHDLGLAAASLTLEATSRGLAVHQMRGILPERAREAYGIPDDFDVVTAIAIGYAAPSENLPDKLRGRDERPRGRKPLAELVFADEWGAPATLG